MTPPPNNDSLTKFDLKVLDVVDGSTVSEIVYVLGSHRGGRDLHNRVARSLTKMRERGLVRIDSDADPVEFHITDEGQATVSR